jgi:hypothetical protein
VQVTQSKGDVDTELDGVLNRKRRRPKRFGERPTLDELRNQQRPAPRIDKKVDHTRDAIAANASEQHCLALEPLDDFDARTHLWTEYLERDAHPSGTVIAGPHFTHAAGGDSSIDAESTTDKDAWRQFRRLIARLSRESNGRTRSGPDRPGLANHGHLLPTEEQVTSLGL